LAPQVRKLLYRKLKGKISRETVDVSLQGSNKLLRLDGIQGGQIRIDHHLLPANQQNRALDPLRRNQCVRFL
jgi:hypothetical protein